MLHVSGLIHVIALLLLTVTSPVHCNFAWTTPSSLSSCCCSRRHTFAFVHAPPMNRHRRHDVNKNNDDKPSLYDFRTSRTSSLWNNNKNQSAKAAVDIRQQQKVEGQLKQRFQKSVSQEDRISALELKLKKSNSRKSSKEEDKSSLSSMTQAEHAELKGLLQKRDTFEEQYDPQTFTKEHVEFKDMHNDAFIQLIRYCQHERQRKKYHCKANIGLVHEDNDNSFMGKQQQQQQQHQKESEPCQEESINIFFLDGPDGGTAKALIHRGNFSANQCYVANRHKSSCKLLRQSGGGLLPDENVVHAGASEALTMATVLTPLSQPDEDKSGRIAQGDDARNSGNKNGAFADIDFAAYYFDGCGGFAPQIIDMLSAALLPARGQWQNAVNSSSSNNNNNSSKSLLFVPSNKPIVIGYSLLGGNKDVVGKELAISQALATMARQRNMRMIHVLDEPTRYGISSRIEKVGGSGGGGTFTTWLLLQPTE